jgi:RNA polymerase sigma factor (sigma-70 family)
LEGVQGVIVESDATVAATISEATLIRLYPSLRRFAAVVAPPEIAPDDLVQDALTAMLRRGGAIVVDDLSAYLRRSLLNLAANHRRSLGRQRRAMIRVQADASVEALDHYPSDLDHLAALRPEARAVLYLQYVEGMSLRAVADTLGLGHAAVRQIAVRARIVLRDDAKEREALQ